MRTGIVIVTWNSRAFIDACVGGLIACGYRSIYVVDNGSSDGSPEYVAERYPAVKVLTLPFNAGFAGGNNHGIRAALQDGNECVCLLNVDTIIDEPFIEPCVEALKRNFSIGIIGPVIVDADVPRRIQCAGGRIKTWSLTFPYLKSGRPYSKGSQLELVDYVLGAGMLVRAEVFSAVGLLDEDYFPAYVEEADLCHRARLAGFRSAISYAVRVRHVGKQSAGPRPLEFRRMMTHRLLFGVKHVGLLRLAVGQLFIAAHIFLSKLRSKQWV